MGLVANRSITLGRCPVTRTSRAQLALVVALATSGTGCALYRIGGASPGHVELWQPPSAPAAHGATIAAPAPEPTLVVSPGVLAGLRSTAIDGESRGSHNGAALGFELGLSWTRLVFEETALPGEAPSDDRRDKSALGLNLGWTPTQLQSGSALHQPTTYVELQWRTILYGLAAGVAFSPGESSNARTGLQLTPLLGPFYSRLEWLFDGSMAFEIGLAIKFPLLFSFGGEP